MEAYFTRGRFCGERIDTGSRRSVSIVAEDAATLTVDHFFHRGNFFRAVIPKRSVCRIHGQRFNFGGTAWPARALVNHAQARFVLDPDDPVRLYSMTDPGGPELESVHDFSYSVEVAGPAGVSWSLRYAFGDFVCAHRLLSTEEVVFERVVLGGFEVVQSPALRLSPDEMCRGLDLVVRRSHAAGMGQPYYLLTKRFGALNCTSAVFTALDEVLRKRYSPVQRILSKLLWRLPINLRRYLRLRSAIHSGVSMPSLNEEFAALARSPELEQRRQQRRPKRGSSSDPG